MASRGKALAALGRGEDSSRGARRQRVPSGFRQEAVARVLTPIAKDSDSSVIESQFHRLKKQSQEAHAALHARLGRTPKKNDYSKSERDTYNKVKALRQALWPGCSRKRERSPAEPPGVKPLDYSSAERGVHTHPTHPLHTRARRGETEARHGLCLPQPATLRQSLIVVSRVVSRCFVNSARKRVCMPNQTQNKKKEVC